SAPSAAFQNTRLVVPRLLGSAHVLRPTSARHAWHRRNLTTLERACTCKIERQKKMRERGHRTVLADDQCIDAIVATDLDRPPFAFAVDQVGELERENLVTGKHEFGVSGIAWSIHVQL